MDPFETAAHARVGQILRGKWRLDSVLGVGGMATVYGATHRNGMRGAVKLLHAELARNANARERFLREGYVANRLERGAVKVLDDDATEDGTVFLVMELLEGHTLEAMTAKRPSGRLEAREVVALMVQLLDTLSLAHAAGIVHRDIKPENLFLTTTGELRVLDFGIARLRDHAGGGVRVTRTQTAMGTPAFMPPEQALANWDAVGPHSDIYSVGASMFMLLTGQITHEARNAAELIVAVATRAARPLASVMPAVSPELAAIVDRALAFSPADRFLEAQTMKGALLKVARTLSPDDPDLERKLTTSPRDGGKLGTGVDATLASGDLPPVHPSKNAIPLVVPFSLHDDPLASTTQAGALVRTASATTAPVSSEPPTGRLPRTARSNRQVILFAGMGLGLVSAIAAVIAWSVVERPHGNASHASATDAKAARTSSPLINEPSSTVDPKTSSVVVAPANSVTPSASVATTEPTAAALQTPSASASASSEVHSSSSPKPKPKPDSPKPKPAFDLNRSD